MINHAKSLAQIAYDTLGDAVSLLDMLGDGEDVELLARTVREAYQVMRAG
jgi:hypothetical protein